MERLLMNFFNIFKKPNETVKKPRHSRAFVGARNNRFTNWLYSSFSKINLDIDNDLLNLMSRTRELSKNNNIVRSYLELMEKNIIGKSGFTLQSQVKDANGELDTALNEEIEWKFYEWGKAANGFLTVDHSLGSKELDKLILRTLLVDGEVFIRIHKNVKNPVGVSFELVDAMSIDFTKRREASGSQNAIVMGIEIDKHYNPVAYYLRPRRHCSISDGERGESSCIGDDSHLQA